MECTYPFPNLPPKVDYESTSILKALVGAKATLAEVKGTAKTIPNQEILINALIIQEAKDSSEIENIVTTHDALFRADHDFMDLMNPETKEVYRYAASLKRGFSRLRSTDGILSNNVIIEMFQTLKARDEGFRSTPGTALRNERTGEIVFVPPQNYYDVKRLMSDLERFINEDNSDLDVLIKMAIIHHQFESIHPFSDGNGRIGRMLNVLYLTKMQQLDTPILYLSREINRTKSDYYSLLQSVRESGDWESWIIYILNAINITAKETLITIEGLRSLMLDFKTRIRESFPKIYSQDLINNLFRHPYTRIEFVENDLRVSRPTATRYLRDLTNAGYLEALRDGNNIYYINTSLVKLLTQDSK